MANLVFICGCLSLVYIIYKVLNHVYLLYCRRLLKLEENCLSPPIIPAKDPILGSDIIFNSYVSICSSTYLSKTLQRFEDNGTTFESKLLGTKVINTIDPENIKAILATQFSEFSLGARRKDAFHPLLGSGIFTTDGEKWKRSRHLLKPAFAKSQLENVELFEIHFKNLTKQFPRDGEIFDLQPLFFQLTMDTATHLFFGESCETLLTAQKEREQADRFALAFNRTQRTIADHFALGPFASFAPQKQFREDCGIVHDFVDEIVARALEAAEASAGWEADAEKAEEGKAKYYIVLDEALKLTQDKLELRGLLMSLLVAGRDTTASLLSNFWFVLVKSPDIWNKLKMEVDELQGLKPDFAALKDLTYLQHCLKEALRLYPSIPFNTRTCEKDTTLPVGGGPDGTSPIFVAAGTPVGYNAWAMHRQKSIYGEDVHNFVPERWEHIRPGWGYIPFNGGPRICLGQQLALTEVAYITVRLVQTFSKIVPENQEPWQESLTLSCSPNNGVRIQAWSNSEE